MRRLVVFSPDPALKAVGLAMLEVLKRPNIKIFKGSCTETLNDFAKQHPEAVKKAKAFVNKWAEKGDFQARHECFATSCWTNGSHRDLMPMLERLPKHKA